MTYDYFYGQQAEMFAFYRVPKVLFTEDCFWNVSTDAKLLYGILLDRMNLSARNGWLDEEGRVYIIFTIEQLLETINKVKRQINPKLKIEGILLTMVDSRTNYSKDISNLIRESYGGKLKVYKTDIPRSVRAEEISAEGTSIFKHDPKGKVAEAYKVLTKEVLNNAEKRRKHQLEGVR